jgi:hypothetical protein
MAESGGESGELLERARQGDRKAIDDLLDCHRTRLRRRVALRMDRRLQGRIDPSDIIHLGSGIDELLADMADNDLACEPTLRNIERR